MLGRLASIIAKQILSGNTIVREHISMFCGSHCTSCSPVVANVCKNISMKPCAHVHCRTYRCACVLRKSQFPAAWCASVPSMSVSCASATTQIPARVPFTSVHHHASSGAPCAGMCVAGCPRDTRTTHFIPTPHHPHSMVPHKTKRGTAALDRLKCFEGIPAPYDTTKRMVVPDALKVLRLQHGHRFCKLGDLSASVCRGCQMVVLRYMVPSSSTHSPTHRWGGSTRRLWPSWRQSEKKRPRHSMRLRRNSWLHVQRLHLLRFAFGCYYG